MKNGTFVDFYDILKLDQLAQRMWFITIGYSSIILPGSIRYTQKEVMGVYKNILMEGVVHLFIICRIYCIELFLMITWPMSKSSCIWCSHRLRALFLLFLLFFLSPSCELYFILVVTTFISGISTI